MSRASLPLVVIVLASTACSGPRDATPMPEPPSMDLSKVRPDMEIVGEAIGTDSTLTTIIPLEGQPGAAPPGSVLLVTPLDTALAPVAQSVEQDGSFNEFTVPGEMGDELRFQVVLGEERGTPQDAYYIGPSPTEPYLTPSLRHDCLDLQPGYEVTFRDTGVAMLTLSNGCDAEITVANARSRTASPGSRTSTALPLTIAAGGSVSLSLEYQGSAFESSEDTLFFDITLEGRAIRYPITLFAP